MLSQKIQDALNEQIKNEFYSSYSYLAMSAFCARQQFNGCAQWLRMQSQEENLHALKLLDFLLARDGKAVLQGIEQPTIDFASIAEVFENALKQERWVTERIDALYELAFQEKAFSALVELEWFITEQVEEEKTAREIVHKFHMLKDDPASLLDLDRDLGSRTAAALTPKG
jgi:ferritin